MIENLKLKIENLKIIFMGTPEFAVPSLKKLAEKFSAQGGPRLSSGNIALVITQPDKPTGRKNIPTPSPVKQAALKLGLPIMQPETENEIRNKFLQITPDLVVVVAFGEILSLNLLDIPQYGIINVHPSLLPKYRGPSPIASAILDGKKETGVTIILLDEEMDHGPVIAQKSVKIAKDDTTKSLSKKLSEISADLVVKVIPKYVKGELKPKPQKDKDATFTALLRKMDGKIDWSQPAEIIERKIRAYHSWPGTYTFWQNKMLKILPPSEVDLQPNNYKVGEVFKKGHNLEVRCGKDSLIIKRVQLEGKKEVSTSEFLRGYPKIIGSILY